MPRLTDLRVAVLATDGFEEVELTQPVTALDERGRRGGGDRPGRSADPGRRTHG